MNQLLLIVNIAGQTVALCADAVQSVIELPADNQFLHAIERFLASINDDRLQQDMRHEIRAQSQLVDAFKAHCAVK